MEQYKYKYYTYSHYHSKLLKPDCFLFSVITRIYISKLVHGYYWQGRKPDLSSYSSLTINNITQYSRYTG